MSEMDDEIIIIDDSNLRYGIDDEEFERQEKEPEFEGYGIGS